MQKFGLFDLIDKLAPLKKAIDTITTKTPPANDFNKVLSNNTMEKPVKKANVQPILSLIKRHDEISKRIDKNLKK